MKINVKDLPMTIDTVRQEVIKKEGERIIGNYEQNYFNIAFVILVVAVMIMLGVGPHHLNKTIFIIELCIIGIAISLISIVMVGKVGQYYRKKLSPKNYGLSDKDIENKMIEYMENILDTMNDELKELDKKKRQVVKEDSDTSEAYYEVYIAYTKNIIEVDPQYFSCMEGGDPYS